MNNPEPHWHVNVEPIVVEVRRLEVQPGDVVVVTPRRKLGAREADALWRSVTEISRRTHIKFIVGSEDVDFTVIAKVDA